MLAIKLKRTGKKHQASFRIVVGEKRAKFRGRATEDLGWLDPKSKKNDLKKDRILYWIKVGAKPTATVHNLLVKEGIVKGTKIAVHKKSKKQPEAAQAAPATEPAAPAA